jgi:hypothetical protein
MEDNLKKKRRPKKNYCFQELELRPQKKEDDLKKI